MTTTYPLPLNTSWKERERVGSEISGRKKTSDRVKEGDKSDWRRSVKEVAVGEERRGEAPQKAVIEKKNKEKTGGATN